MEAIPVVAAVIQDGPAFLLTQRTHANHGDCDCPDKELGRWELPGGKVEPTDLSLEDALRREIREELGVEVVVMRALYACVNTYASGQAYLVVYYHCYVFRGYSVQHSGTRRWVEKHKAATIDVLPGTLEALEHCRG